MTTVDGQTDARRREADGATSRQDLAVSNLLGGIRVVYLVEAHQPSSAARRNGVEEQHTLLSQSCDGKNSCDMLKIPGLTT